MMPLETDHLRETLQRKAPKANPTSYPFLALSIVRNVPYADVLNYADYCEWSVDHRRSFPLWPSAEQRLDTHTRQMIMDHVCGVRDIAKEVPRIAP